MANQRSSRGRRKLRGVRLLLVLLLLAGVLGGGGYVAYRYQRTKNTEKLLAQARDAAAAEQWGAAATAYRQYLNRREDDQEALAAYADVLYEEIAESPQAVGAAVRTLQRLVRGEPSNAKARGRLAELLLRLGDFPLAEEHAKVWVTLAPDSSDAVLTLAGALRGQRRHAESAQVLEEALARNPQSAALYPSLLGLYTVELDRQDDAEALLERALAIGEDDASVHLAAFALYSTRRDFAAAEHHLAKALERDPNGPAVLLTGASYYTEQGRLEDARPLLVRAAAVAPKHSGLMLVRATWATRTGDPDEMSSAADALLAAASDRELSLVARAAELYLNARRLDKADECLATLNQSTESTEVIRLWTQALQGTRALYSGAPFQAVATLEDVLRRRPSDPTTLRMLAQAYSQTESWEAAADAYRRLVAIEPQSTGVRLTLARIELQLGRPAAARNHLSQLPTTTPGEANQVRTVLLAADMMDAVQNRRAPADNPAMVEALRTLAAQSPPDEATARSLATCFALAGYPTGLREVLDARMGDPETGLTIAAEYVRFLLAGPAPESAESVIKAMEARWSEAAEPRELRVQWLAAMGRVEEAEALIASDAGDDAAKGRMYAALGERMLNANDRERGLAALRRAADLRPGDIGLRQRLGRLATSQEEGIRLAQEIRAVEGDAGLTWRVEQAAALLRLDPTPTSAEKAVRLLEPCVATRPNWSAAHALLGTAHEIGGRPAEATESYRRAIAQQPDLGAGPVGFRLVQALKRQGRFEEADAALSRLAESSPMSPDVLRLQTERHLRGNNITAAAESAEALLHLRSSDAEWAAVTADLQMRAGQSARAEEIARQALAAVPASPSLLWTLARVLIAQDRSDEAEQAVRAALAAHPDAEHRWVLVQTLVTLGRSEESERVVEEAVAAHPQNSDLLAGAAEFWATRGRRDKQVALARRAVAARGEDPAESLALAELLISGDSAERAEADAIVKRRVKTAPDDPRALVLEAQWLITSDPPQLDIAAAALERAIALRVPSPRAHRLLTAVHMQRRDLAQATNVASSGLAQWPDDVDLLLAVADIAMFQGDYERAVGPLRHALEVRPQWPAAVRKLAAVYINLDQARRGIEWLERTPPARRTPAEVGALARLYEGTGDMDRAAVLYGTALTLSAEAPEAFQELLQFYGRRGDFKRIREAAETRRGSAPADAASWLIAARMLSLQGTDAELRQVGLDWLEAIAREVPASAAEATYHAGLCLYNQKDYAQAESRFLQAAQLAPRWAEPINALAWLYSEDLKRPQDAQGALQRFLQAGGEETAEMLDTHGMVLMRLGDLEGARRKFLECRQLAGQSHSLTAATYHLGLVLEAQGKMEEAATNFERARQLDRKLGGLSEKDRARLNQRSAPAEAGDAASAPAGGAAGGTDGN